jgi:hypothetical protein
MPPASPFATANCIFCCAMVTKHDVAAKKPTASGTAGHGLLPAVAARRSVHSAQRIAQATQGGRGRAGADWEAKVRACNGNTVGMYCCGREGGLQGGTGQASRGRHDGGCTCGPSPRWQQREGGVECGLGAEGERHAVPAGGAGAGLVPHTSVQLLVVGRGARHPAAGACAAPRPPPALPWLGSPPRGDAARRQAGPWCCPAAMRRIEWAGPLLHPRRAERRQAMCRQHRGGALWAGARGGGGGRGAGAALAAEEGLAVPPLCRQLRGGRRQRRRLEG